MESLDKNSKTNSRLTWKNVKALTGLLATEQLRVYFVTHDEVTIIDKEMNPATCLSVLVLVEGQKIGAELVKVHTILALLTEFEVLAEGPLHHHLFAAACAYTGDVTLSVYYQYLQKYINRSVLHAE